MPSVIDRSGTRSAMIYHDTRSGYERGIESLRNITGCWFATPVEATGELEFEEAGDVMFIAHWDIGFAKVARMATALAGIEFRSFDCTGYDLHRPIPDPADFRDISPLRTAPTTEGDVSAPSGADTDQPLSAAWLRDAFDALFQPTQREEATFNVDPDDYPVV